MEIFNLIKLSQAESLPIPVEGKVTLRNLDEAHEQIKSAIEKSAHGIEGQGNLFIDERGEDATGPRASHKSLSNILFIKNAFVGLIKSLADNIDDFEPSSDQIWEHAQYIDYGDYWDSYSDQAKPEYIHSLAEGEDEDLSAFLIEKIQPLVHDQLVNPEEDVSEDDHINNVVENYIGSVGNNPIREKDLRKIISDKIIDIKRDYYDLEDEIADAITESIIKNVMGDLSTGDEDDVSLQGYLEVLEDDLQDHFENDAWDWWIERNSEWLTESYVENEADNANYEMKQIDKSLQGNLIIDFYNPESNHPTPKYSGPLAYLADMDAGDIDESDPYDSLSDWWDVPLSDFEDITSDHDEMYYFSTDDLKYESDRHISMIKKVINSDLYLKDILFPNASFTNDGNEDTNLDIHLARGADSVILMDIGEYTDRLTESQKTSVFKSLEIDEGGIQSALARIEEQRRIDEERRLIEEKEAKEREKLRDELEKKKKEYTDNVLRKDLEGRMLPEDIERAREIGVATKPFEHAYQMQLNPFPGKAVFNKDIESKSKQYAAIPFTIAMYSKNVGRINESVFKDMQYHGISDLEGQDWSEGYHQAMGWIGGWIDVHNNSMYVGEIQSDLMQNTHEMKDSNITIKIKEDEMNNLNKELHKLESQEDNYGKSPEDQVNLLKEKLMSVEPGSRQYEGISRAIENIKQQGESQQDSNKENKIRRIKLLITQLNEQLEADRATKSTPGGLSRPHLHEYKSRVENAYKNWVSLFWNTIFRNIKKYEIDTLYVISASGLMKRWSSYAKDNTKTLFERVYDEFAQKFGGKPKGDWWEIPINDNRKIIMANNWYKNIKTAQFENIDISDLIESFNNGEISQEELKSKINARYTQEASSANENPFLLRLKTFINKYVQVMKREMLDPVLGQFEEYSNIGDIEMEGIVRDAFIEFKKDIDDEYKDEDGELKDPYYSVAQRYLIQEYDFDPYEDEYRF